VIACQSVRKSTVADELLVAWLPGLDGAQVGEARALLTEIVDAWQFVAESQEVLSPDEIYAFAQEQLELALRGHSVAERLLILRQEAEMSRLVRLGERQRGEA